MSTNYGSIAPDENLGAAKPAPAAWFPPPWAVVTALVLAEALAVSFRYDAGGIAVKLRGVSVLAWLFSHLTDVFRGAVVAALAAAFLGGRRFAAVLTGPGKPAWSEARVYLAAQVVAFLAFFGLSAAVLEPGAVRPGLTAAWASLGLACALLGAAAAVPPRLWRPLFAAAPGALAVSAVVGAAPAAMASLADSTWHPLGGTTVRLVGAFLGLVRPDIVCEPETHHLSTERFQVGIAAPCSGFEGIGLMTALLGGYLWSQRRSLRPWRAWPILPLGVATIFVFNALRIAAIFLIGDMGYPEIAIGGFHSQAGWIAFLAVGLTFVALSRRPWFRVDAADAGPGERPAAVDEMASPAPYIVPLLALVGTTMLTTAFSPNDGFDRAYPLRFFAVVAALWAYRATYRGPTRALVTWSWPAVATGVLVFGLWMAMEPRPTGPAADSPPAAYLALPAALAWAWAAFRVLGSVVTVPIAEELAFRGYLIRRLVAADFDSVPPGRFTWLSFVGSSALFGALHGRFLAGTVAGLVYALLLYRRGRVGECVLAHAVTNALIAATVLIGGAWSLWS